ncbi:Phosphate-selective porin O and P [Maribacter sedimenticola]|uniref:Phosphate-selective porin O and P n=1 Tax=Maribacter sedimenticola TaxID=228956 RepID=A0ABY1SD05_9FLAO|nr:porin [Maribacter sedimenticola]SNR26103.1 Phosphate-selective porin O and P [Maribacter sedimenticola]
MKYNLFWFSLFLLYFSAIKGQESNAPTFGNGLFNLVGKDSSWTMKVEARMQILATNTWNSENGGLTDPEQNFLVRRARLKFDGFAYSPKLEYKIELGLSNRDISGASQFTGNAPRYILDAVVKWNFYENFVLWFGQTKLPGNIERVISSGNLLQVDRSLLNGRFTIDRDMGFQLRHKTNIGQKFLIREIFALSQGEGRNITTGNLGGLQYTSRLELLPFGEFLGRGDYKGSDLNREKTPKLMIAATYDSNQNAVKSRSNQGSYLFNDVGFFETNINTVFIDAMFKYNGFSFMGEYANRTAKDPIAKNSDGSATGSVVEVGSGLNLQSGYLFENNWEVSGRFTTIGLDQEITGQNTQNQYTLGLSKYIVGHKLKVQSDLSYLSQIASTDILTYRLQLEVHF